MRNRWRAQEGDRRQAAGRHMRGDGGRVGDSGRGGQKEGYEAVGVLTQRPRMGGRLRARRMRVCVIP